MKLLLLAILLFSQNIYNNAEIKENVSHSNYEIMGIDKEELTEENLIIIIIYVTMKEQV